MYRGPSEHKKNKSLRCFHFDSLGHPVPPVCTRPSHICGFVHPDEPEWTTAKPSKFQPGRKPSFGRSFHEDDHDDRPLPPTPSAARNTRKEAALLIARISEETAKEKDQENPAASSSKTKVTVAPPTRESAPATPRLDIPTSSVTKLNSAPTSAMKTTSGPMGALNQVKSPQQQQTATPTTTLFNKSAPKPSKPPPIIPPPPNSAFTNTFSTMSLQSPGFFPKSGPNQPQSSTTEDDAMHIDQPLGGSGAGNKVTSDAQHQPSPPVDSTPQQPPPPPNPPPELPYQPPPPVPGLPDGLRLNDDRSRQASVALSDTGSLNRVSMSEDPRYKKWMDVIRVLSRCTDIEGELRTIDNKIKDAQCFMSMGALDILDSSMEGMMAAPNATPTYDASSAPASATAPSFNFQPSSGLPPSDITEQLKSLIAQRQALLKEKAENEEELIHMETWPGMPQGPSASEATEQAVDYSALVDTVTSFKDMVESMLQLLSQHVTFLDDKSTMPALPDELSDLRGGGEDGEEDGGDEDDSEMERESEQETEPQNRGQSQQREHSTKDRDQDGDIAMEDAPREKNELEKEEKEAKFGAARGHKRRRLNSRGDAEPSAEEMEKVLNALQALEDKIMTLQNDSTQAEETWKEEYQGIIEARADQLEETLKKKMSRYRSKAKQLEKEKEQWEAREKKLIEERDREREEREKEKEKSGEMEGVDQEQEREWMSFLLKEEITMEQEDSADRQVSMPRVWNEVQGLSRDVEAVKREVALSKTEVQELTRELAMERVAFEEAKEEAKAITARLDEQARRQETLSTALSAMDTYIRVTTEEIATHRAALQSTSTPTPQVVPSQRVLLQTLEPLLIQAVREDIRPRLIQHRQEIEHTVQEGAKVSFAQFVAKLGLTMNILEAIHKRLDADPTMLESIAESVRPRGASSSSS